MTKNIYYTLIIILLLFLNSCTDIIKLDLKSVEPKIIIEANLTATDSTCTVVVTKSNSFYDNTEPIKVTNLNVTLSDQNSNSYNLTETEDGVYFADNIIATAGDKFTIQITDDEANSYTANAITPSNPGPFLVIFSSITDPDIIVTDSLGNDRILLFALAYWFDIPNEENYYRFKIYQDDEYKADSYNFLDDQSAFGDTLQRGLSGGFFEGDTIDFHLLSINKETYTFFEQLQEVLNSGMNSTTPYNPKGNFDNGALGYFCIQQIVKEQFIVQKFPDFK